MPAKPELRVFLDTNVIFSGLYSAQSSPGIIIDYYVQGKLKVVVSRQVIDELVRTLKEKLPEALPALRTMLLSMPPEVVANPPVTATCYWQKFLQPGDATILAAAIMAQPDFFITGDNHFLDMADAIKEAGISILTPAEFLKQVPLSR
jgi:putative PIN family toxin of toxin-antitoxin system